MLDVAVVGAGNRGATHLDTIARLSDLYRLVGVCDAREERRAWAAAQYAVPTFDHPVALIEQARPQVVAVVVPPDAHHLVTAAAAARGCHVLSETPIATTLAMADHMIESCRRGGQPHDRPHDRPHPQSGAGSSAVVLEVAENVWRFPQERLKRLAIDAGLIGEVAQVHLWYRSGSYHGMNALRRFITRPPRRALGLSREFPVAPFRDAGGGAVAGGSPTGEPDGRDQRRQTWEFGAIDFEGGQMAVYQWPVGSDRGNLWEVVGSEGALMGTDLVRFDGPNGTRRRIPIETIYEDAPGGGAGIAGSNAGWPGGGAGARGSTTGWPGGARALAAMRLAAGPGAHTVEWENPYRRYHLLGPDDVARADIYAGLHETITLGVPSWAHTGGWPAPPPTAARFYGAPNARADQELLIALRESARRGSAWLDLPLRSGEPTAFERQLHHEFEQTYGAPPFDDPERLLGKLFPRRGLTQTVH